jgi:hypothetical protein
MAGYPTGKQGERRMMQTRGFPAAGYEIEVLGELDELWASWFNDMTVAVKHASDGSPVTILTICAVDQARLRGILNKLWDLNLTVISLNLLAE